MIAPRSLPPWIWGFWIIANLVGVGIIALPDDDNRLFSISETHGPSLLDAIGILALLAGWLLLSVATLVRWRRLAALGRTRLLGGALLYAIGIVILIPTILWDLGLWWMVGAAVMASVQIGAAVAVSR